MGKLVHFRGDGTAVELRLDRQRITIGRRPDNDMCLPYPAVSGEHAAVVTILADSFLEDLGSTNGTLVNGATISKHFLRDRDRIDVGQQILTYVADDAAAVESPLPTGKSQDTPRQRESTDPALIAPAALRAKRRSDVAAPAPVSPTEAVDRIATARNVGGLPVEPPAVAPAAPPVAAPAAPPVAAPAAPPVAAPAAPPVAAPAAPPVAAPAAPPVAAPAAPPVAAPAAPPAVAPAAPPAATPAPDAERALAAPSQRRTRVEAALKVVSGAKAGRIVALVKDETLIGRAGVQVVALRRGADELRVVPMEGAFPPSVNGMHVVPEGQPLAVGDILEVAGTKLEVVAALKRSLD